MPASVTDIDLSAAKSFFAGPTSRHLRLRKRGDTIVIESGPPGDAYPHLRVRKHSATKWGIDAATHTGRWDPMPLQGPLLELLTTVAENFPWLLAKLD